MKKRLWLVLGVYLTWSLSNVAVVFSNPYLFYDDFNDGDDEGWQVIDGTWVVESGAYKGTRDPSTSVGKSVTGSDEWTDFQYEGRFKFGAGSFEASLLFRIQQIAPGMNTGYLYQIGNHIDGLVVLHRLYGTGVEHLMMINCDFTHDVWYNFRIVLQGTHIDYFINDAFIFAYDELTHYSNGKIGVKVAWWSGPTYFDDLRVSPIPIGAEVAINPDTLNLKSNGEWITAYIELPEGQNVNDIDVNSILLNGTIPVDAEAPTEVGDYDLDDFPDLMIKFDRATVIDWMGTADYGEDTGKYYEMNLTIIGIVAGTQFSCTDKIKVLRK